MKQHAPDNSPQYLDKKPTVNVVGLNKLALVLGVLLVILVVSVIVFSTTSSRVSDPTVNTLDNASSDHTPPAQLQATSHAIPGHKPSQLSAHPLSIIKNAAPNRTPSIPDMVSQDKSELDKRHEQLLLEALNAPLNATSDTPSREPITESSSTASAKEANDDSIPSSSLSQHKDADQNRQQEKQAFLRVLKDKLDSNTLEERLTLPHSRFEVLAGSVIPAITASGINSDLPGQFTALVRQNVYDSVSGRYLLIPQGSKLIMLYDSQLSFGQERVLVAAKRLIFPNGQSMNLQGMPGVDSKGFSGFHDEVNNHYVKLFGSSLLLGLISAGFQLSQPQQSSSFQNPGSGQTLAAALGQQLGEVSSQMMQKNLNIQPTLMIRPGYTFNITVTADMIFPNPYLSHSNRS